MKDFMKPIKDRLSRLFSVTSLTNPQREAISSIVIDLGRSISEVRSECLHAIYDLYSNYIHHNCCGNGYPEAPGGRILPFGKKHCGKVHKPLKPLYDITIEDIEPLDQDATTEDILVTINQLIVAVKSLDLAFKSTTVIKEVEHPILPPPVHSPVNFDPYRGYCNHEHHKEHHHAHHHVHHSDPNVWTPYKNVDPYADED